MDTAGMTANANQSVKVARKCNLFLVFLVERTSDACILCRYLSVRYYECSRFVHLILSGCKGTLEFWMPNVSWVVMYLAKHFGTHNNAKYLRVFKTNAFAKIFIRGRRAGTSCVNFHKELNFTRLPNGLHLDVVTMVVKTGSFLLRERRS